MARTSSPRRPRTKPALDPALEAMTLLGRWTRLAPRGFGGGFSCSCCAIAPGVRVSDFEHDILGYLHDKHAARGTPGVAELLAIQADFQPGGAGSVVKLLRALAVAGGQSKAIGDDTRRALLADLARCLESIEEQQGR